MMGGGEWRKRVENRSKPNSQLFGEYLELIKASKSRKWYLETLRIIGQFHQFLGEFPPTLELFTTFFQRYNVPGICQSTRARYYYVFSAFFKWYDGSSLPFKIKSIPKPPQKVLDEEVDKLKEAITSRKTHKKELARDLLIVDLLYHTGMRLSELTDLRVGDLRLIGASPYLKVREGKGGKERDINLNRYICASLKSFTGGMPPEKQVIGIASKTIQSNFRAWAIKGGVPQLHPHSLRHKFATDILDRGGSIRDVQYLLGHASLATTEAYLALSNEGLKKSVDLLDPNRNRFLPPPPTDEANENIKRMKAALEEIKTTLAVGTEHAGTIREAAGKLANRIVPPPLADTSLWRGLPLEFRPGRYPIPGGTIEIGPGKGIRVEYTDPASEGSALHLTAALESHLTTSAVPRLADLAGDGGMISRWKEAVEKRDTSFLKLVREITEELKGVKAKTDFTGEAKPGLTRWFIMTVCLDALQAADGHPWIGDDWYTSDEKISGTGLRQLRCGAYVIGIAGTIDEIKLYQEQHKALRSRFAGSQLVADVAQADRKLAQEADDIRQRLQEFSDMRQLPGRCGLC
jgi:integrase/recombinase XerD